MECLISSSSASSLPFSTVFCACLNMTLLSEETRKLIPSSSSLLEMCRKYLADPSIDVRNAAHASLADFLREMARIASIKKQQAAEVLAKKLAGGRRERDGDDDAEENEEGGAIWQGTGSGEWVPGQGVPVHYREIVDILLRHVNYPGSYIIPF
jgi:hypothetical protein